MSKIVNMRVADDKDVREIVHAGRIAQRARIMRDLLSGKPTDISGDPALVMAASRLKLTAEEAMMLAPKQHLKDTKEAADHRRSSDPKDYNPKSPSKMRQLGYIPTSVYFAQPELWGNPKAIKRFLNNYPKFRVNSGRI